jgi:hypothetical protein
VTGRLHRNGRIGIRCALESHRSEVSCAGPQRFRGTISVQNVMRDQYAGDISDLLKLALLRALIKENDTLGVGWYYNPVNDGRPDGRRREYCDEPKWRVLDSALWSTLRELPHRSVEGLEKLSIWPPGTRFHRIAVPSMERRGSWALDMKTALEGSSVVFLDPDNGIGATERHATIHEIEMMRQIGRAVVLIKFPGRTNHDRQLEAFHASLRSHRQCSSSLATLRTTVWIKQPTLRWFTIIDAADSVMARAERFVHTLNGIAGCKADLICGNKTGNAEINEASVVNHREQRSHIVSAGAAADHVQKVCPECGHQFKGKGFDGIDAHWRAKHESVMPYAEAWPLINSGSYPGSE